jgi:hypothetical protein
VYKVSYNNVLNNVISSNADSSDTATINSFEQIFRKIPIQMNGTYNIVSNGKYMIIEGRIDSTFSGRVSVHFSGRNAIVDLQNKLVYLPEEMEIEKIKLYSLKDSVNKKEECPKKYIQEKGPDVEVRICKKIPKSIVFPQVLFTNAEYGIQSIHAPSFDIELVSYKRIKADKRLLSCKKYFNDKSLPVKEFDFFDR